MKHFQPVFSRWDGKASDMARAINLPRMTVRQWMLRDSIPPEHWLVVSAQSGVSLADLAECARSRASSRIAA